MTDDPETKYFKAWKNEIKQGADAGKLTSTNGRADLRTVAAPTDSIDYQGNTKSEAE